MAQTEKRIIDIAIKGQQANATLKEIEGSARALRAQLKKLPTDSQEFAEKTKELQQVNKRLQKINDDIKGVGGMFGKIGKEIKGFGILAAGYLGFDFITGSIKNIIGQNAKLSDSLADIQKTTGMTTAEAKNLNKAFGQMNTRTASSELRNIAVAAGQLGIAKGQILAFTAATDKLVVALGDEFTGGAEEVTKQLGGLRNSFLDIKTDNVSDDMLKIGNAINELGSSGAATGPVISDFSNRIGGVGISFGLTSGQVLGLSATLQELNVTSERGGTAVVKILQKMSKDTESFAKVAGVPVKQFTDLVNKDLFGAFVKVAEGAKKGGGSATALAKILEDLGVEGSGASEVFAKLGNNTDLLDKRVQLANNSLKSTDSIMKEFNTKNDTLAGDLEKISKGMASAFANSTINEGLKSITHWVAELFDNTKKVSQSMEEEQARVNALAIEMKSSNTTQERRVEIYDELLSINPKILEGIDRENISMQALTDNVRKYNSEQINRIVIQKKQEEIDKAVEVAAEKRLDMAERETLIYTKLADIHKIGGTIGIKARQIIDDENKSLQEKLNLLQELSNKNKGYYNLKGEENQQKIALMHAVSWFNSYRTLEKDYQQANEASAKIIEEKNELMKQLGITTETTGKIEVDYTKLSLEQLNKYIKDAKESNGAYHAQEAAMSKKELERRKQNIDTTVGLEDDAKKKQIEAYKKYLEELAKLEEEYNFRHMTDLEQEQYKIFKHYDELLKKAKGHAEQERKLNLFRDAELEVAYKKDYEKNKEKYAAQDQLALDHFYKTGELLKKTQEAELKPMKPLDFTDDKAAVNSFIEFLKSKNKDISEEDIIAAFKRRMKVFSEYYNSTRNIISNLGKAFENQDEARLKSIDRNAKKQAEIQKHLLDKRLISEKQYDAKIAEIERKAEQDRINIERKQAQRKKLAGLFEIGVNTAVAITEAAPNILKMAIAAATGITQAAVVLSKPVPYAAGGLTMKNGGNINSPHIALAGEAGPEWVAPNWMLESPVYGPRIKALEAVRSNYQATGNTTVSSEIPNYTRQSVNDTGPSSAYDIADAMFSAMKKHFPNGFEARLNHDNFVKDQKRITDAKAAATISKKNK